MQSQQTWDDGPTLVYCWPSVVDGGPTVNQRWAHVSCLLGLPGIRPPHYKTPLEPRRLICRSHVDKDVVNTLGVEYLIYVCNHRRLEITANIISWSCRQGKEVNSPTAGKDEVHCKASGKVTHKRQSRKLTHKSKTTTYSRKVQQSKTTTMRNSVQRNSSLRPSGHVWGYIP